MSVDPSRALPPLTGLTAFAAGEPLPGLHLELRLSRTTFVAGALIRPQVVVYNTNSADTSVYVRVAANPQTDPADPRSFPTVLPEPRPGRPAVVVAAGQSQTFSFFVQLPFDANVTASLHAAVQVGKAIAAADIPMKLTSAGPAQQLRILDLTADRRQWCARATDSSGGTPKQPLFASITARAASGYMQGPISSDTSSGEWAGRFAVVNPPPTDPLTVDVFAGGEDYVTSHAEISVSRE